MAKEKGRRAVCVSNLRQLTIAFTNYADDDAEERYPAAHRHSDHVTRIYSINYGLAMVLKEYGLPAPNESKGTVWACPSAENPPRGLKTAAQWGGPDDLYLMDNMMILTDLKSIGSKYLGSTSPTFVRDVQDTPGPLVADSNLRWWGSFTEPTLGGNHTNMAGGDTYVSWTRLKSNPVGMNQAFTDGHVSWYTMATWPGQPYNGHYINETTLKYKAFWVE